MFGMTGREGGCVAAEVLESHVLNVDRVRRALEFEGLGP